MLKNIFAPFITNASFLPNMDIIIANSGGQDSMSLFLFYQIIQNQYRLNLILIYCNHLWQVDSIPVTLHLANFYHITQTTFIAPVAVTTLRTEESARTWRYAQYDRSSLFTSAKISLIGHTTSDRVESFLLNLFRGTGLAGLTTMPNKRLNNTNKFKCFSGKKTRPSILILLKSQNPPNLIKPSTTPSLTKYCPSTSKSGKNNQVQPWVWTDYDFQESQPQFLTQLNSQSRKKPLTTQITRPLLLLNRYEVQILIRFFQMPFWTDQTNFQMKYRRNRLRLNLLPAVRFYVNPCIDLCILRSIEILNQEHEYLQNLTTQLIHQDVFVHPKLKLVIQKKNVFYAYPEIIKQRILIQILQLVHESKMNSSYIATILKILLLSPEFTKSQCHEGKTFPEKLCVTVFQLSKHFVIISYADYFIFYNIEGLK